MKSILGQDHYSLLEVARFAAKSDVVKAYHRLKAAFDPDSLATYSLFSPEEARQIAIRVDEAFRVLIDERKKEVYDRWLDGRERGLNAPEPVFSRDAAGEQLATAALATAGTTEIKPFSPRKPPVLRPVPGSSFPHSERASIPPPATPAMATAPVAAPASIARFALDGASPRAPDAPAPVAMAAPAGPVVDEDALKALMGPERERDGVWFRNVREARGFTLQQIAEKTKISQMYLRFIEENNYRDLPAPVYLRGFLVQVSRFHKLESPDQIAEQYMAIADRRKKENS